MKPNPRMELFIGCLAVWLGGFRAIGAEGALVVPLWPHGAPGFEDRRDEPERTQGTSVGNVHNPSITVLLPPKEKANGAAVLICPGGGHRQLVFQAEGIEPAQYLNSLGVAAFVLKYRLARETNSPYSLQVHPRQDALRAMRLIRSRASEWNLDTNRIGIMGFSAGGEVVSLMVYGPTEGGGNAPDPIDRQDGKANFQIVIYPGPLGVPDRIPTNAPPAFFLVASDDASHVAPVVSLLEKYRQAGRPVEAHILSGGGHGFKLGARSKLAAVRNWPQRLADWLADNSILPEK
jgi:acetyl esterase/lipase